MDTEENTQDEAGSSGSETVFAGFLGVLVAAFALVFLQSPHESGQRQLRTGCTEGGGRWPAVICDGKVVPRSTEGIWH
jgi:hypothetical protein